MKCLFWVLLIFTSAPAWGRSPVAMEHFSLQLQQFDHNRDPYVIEYTDDWLYRVQMNADFSLLGALYMHNRVHTEAIRSGPVKTVGWHWELGLRLHENVTIFHEHHSRHVMEERPPVPEGRTRGYPVEDSYGLRITIIEDTAAISRSVAGYIFGGK